MVQSPWRFLVITLDLCYQFDVGFQLFHVIGERRDRSIQNCKISAERVSAFVAESQEDGFDLEELPFTGESNLPLNADPKQAWAQMYLADSPIEVNKAEKRELIRIPGIGLKGAEAILRERRSAYREHAGGG